jgi:hypothetical protein
MPAEVRGTALDLVERFAIAGSLEEHLEDAACQTTIFASGAVRIERTFAKRIFPFALICGAEMRESLMVFELRSMRSSQGRKG